MRKETLKIIASTVGVVSFLYSIYCIIIVVTIFQSVGFFEIKMLTRNITLSYLFLSPLSVMGIFFSSFGLYKMKKWGYILSNVSLVVFIGGFLLVVINHLFPNLLDTTVQSDSGWFIFYHMNFNIETIAAPIVSVALLIFLNRKSTRLCFHG